MSRQTICSAPTDDKQRAVRRTLSGEQIESRDFVRDSNDPSTVYIVRQQDFRPTESEIDMRIQVVCGSDQCTKHEFKYSRTVAVHEIEFLEL